MRRGPGGSPDPGWITGTVFRRLLAPRDWRRLRDELADLYEHRARAGDRPSADRWIRGEYRRLALRVLAGERLDGRPAERASRSSGTPSGAVSDTLLDLRHGVRGLRRAPLFTLAIVLTVGIGIGGASLVFSLVQTVLVAPLPYPGGERMVLLRTVEGENMWGTSMADVHALAETPPGAFEAVAAYTRRTSRVAVATDVELLPTKYVSPSYFTLLGIEPVAGRHLLDEEGRPGAGPAVLITEDFRARNFPGGIAAIGRSLLVDGRPHTVVGVLPDRLGPLDRGIDVFPALEVAAPSRKGPFFFPTIARLRPDVDPSVARAQLEAVSERIFPIWQESFTQRGAVLGFVDLKEAVVGSVGRTLWIVFAAVVLLLVIASANASSLLVARGVTRSREISVRAALGASRGRVTRLLLTEALVIATAAAGVGIVLVTAGAAIVRRLGVGYLPRVEEVGWSMSAIAFFALVTFASWVLFGVLAAATTARSGTRSIASTSARATASPGILALRSVLAGAQFAVTIPLLVGAGLLVQSLGNVRNESFGFDPDGLASMLVTLPEESFPGSVEVRDFWAATLPRIEALPGVVSAGLADARPPEPLGGGNNFVLEDRPVGPDEPQPTAPWITADAGFFETLGLRVVEGRIYAEAPGDTMRHAVVDESWAARFHPDGSPVGRRFRSGGCTVDGCPWTEIVGVVSDVKTAGLDDTRRQGTIYYDFARDSHASMQLHIRSRGEVLSLVPSVREVMRSQASGVAVADVRTPMELAGESLADRRYSSTLVALLAGIALLLSVIGVYGTMAYYVRQHVREIGIRIALGGGPAGALRMVVMRGMTIAAAGTFVGLAATPALTRPLGSLLYGIDAGAWVVPLVVTVGTLGVALAATVLPGRQAARTDPADTLREA
jgi:predicted permease